MPHVLLLGDSIFDNAPYTAGGPCVIEQLSEALPRGSSATLRAVDGATTDDVPRQLSRLPRDVTHLVLSVGGNDALRHAGILEMRVSSAREALVALTEHGFIAPERVALIRGSGVPLDREAYRRSVEFWESNANWRP